MTPLLACIPDDETSRKAISDLIGHECLPYPNSIPGRCGGCSCKVWIGPVQAKFVGVAGAHVLCLPCAVPHALTRGAVIALTAKEYGGAN